MQLPSQDNLPQPSLPLTGNDPAASTALNGLGHIQNADSTATPLQPSATVAHHPEQTVQPATPAHTQYQPTTALPTQHPVSPTPATITAPAQITATPTIAQTIQPPALITPTHATQSASPFAVHHSAPQPVPLQNSNQIDQGNYRSQAATRMDNMNTYNTMEPTTSPPAGIMPTAVQPQSGHDLLAETYRQQPLTALPAAAHAIPTAQPAQNLQQVQTNGQPAQYQTPQQHPVKKKRKKKKLLIGLIAGIGGLLLIGVVAALLYFFWYLPNLPNNVVARSVVETALSDSSNGRIILDYDVRSSESGVVSQFELTGGLAVEVNIPDESDTVSGSLSIRKTTLRFEDSSISDRPIELTIAEIPTVIQGIATEDRYYVQVNGAENLLSGVDEITDLILDQFKDSVSATQLSELRTDIDTVVADALEQVSQLNDRWFSETFDGVSYLEDLRSESTNTLTACLQNSGQLETVTKGAISSYIDNPVFEVLTDHGKETVRETVEARHFTVKFNETNYSAFVSSVASKARTSSEIVSCIEDSEYAEILENPQFTGDQEIQFDPDDQLPDLIFDLWIDGDTTIRQLQFSFDQDNTKADISVGYDIIDEAEVTVPDDSESIDVISTELEEALNSFTQDFDDLSTKYSESSTSTGLSTFGDSSDDLAALEDIGSIQEAINKYTEDGPSVPLTEADLNEALDEDLLESLSETYLINFTGSNVIVEANQLHYSNRAYCDGNFVTTTLDPQSYAILVRLPSGSYSCTDNDKGPNQFQPNEDDDGSTNPQT